MKCENEKCSNDARGYNFAHGKWLALCKSCTAKSFTEAWKPIVDTKPQNMILEFKEDVLKNLNPEQLKECEEWLIKANKIVLDKLSQEQNEIYERIINHE